MSYPLRYYPNLKPDSSPQEVKIAKFVINGGRTLSGEIIVYGAKNAAIKMIAACILMTGEVVLNNIPDILDINNLSEILIRMGASIRRDNHQLIVNTAGLKSIDPDPDLVRAMRASVVLVGPLLARFRQVHIPHPGGDKIGARPIDLHIKAFQKIGCEVEQKSDEYFFNCKQSQSTTITFGKITVTGTENIILFAALGRNKIIIENAAIEPEIIDLIEFLKSAGAKISVNGRQITIIGCEKLIGPKHTCIPDRLEAATFAVLAAASGSDLKIKDICSEHLKAFLKTLNTIGVKFEITGNVLHIRSSGELVATDIKTAEYPDFSTDWQPPVGLLLTQAGGKSHINENVHENRLGYLNELKQMGAKINILDSHRAEIIGPTKLHGAEIDSLDIRAGATLIIAGLIAKGITQISQAENIDRGYEKIEERLQNLGAKIRRIS